MQKYIANIAPHTISADNMQDEVLPPGVEPLVLWEPPEGSSGKPILVDNMLTKWLRPHQREGVRFLFGCVAGLRGSGRQGV